METDGDGSERLSPFLGLLGDRRRYCGGCRSNVEDETDGLNRWMLDGKLEVRRNEITPETAGGDGEVPKPKWQVIDGSLQEAGTRLS